jgi:predicted ATPase/DNA-binding XRE family transcriptional regulator
MGQKKYIRNQKLREARELRGWSQQNVAEQLGLSVDKSTVSRWERGVAVPQPHYRQKLAEIFQTNVQELGFLKDPERSTRKPLYKIPRLSTPLFGRDQEIENIKVRLLQQDVQLLTLLGSGGVGKTRVGIEIASQMRQHFSDGLCFVPLATVCDPALIGPTLAKELEIHEFSALPQIDQIKNFLSDKSFLLLLDNFEHIVATAPFIENLLDASPHLKVIVTSREALHLQAEFRFTIFPLPVPDLRQSPSYEDLAHSAVVSLFAERAMARKRTFQVNPQNICAIVELCAHLDGLPLAIELAASHVEILPPQALMTHFSTCLYWLRNHIRNAPLRQQTLSATIQWSYDLLSNQEQWLFRRLALFAGGVSLTALETFFAMSEMSNLPSLVENIRSLIDKSLLISTDLENAGTRFTMLETIRHYGLDCLRAKGELEKCQRSYATFYLSLVEKVAPCLFGKQQAIGLQQLEQQQDNLRIALGWLIEQRESLLALRFCEAFGKFCGLHGYWSEERRWLKLTLDLPSVSEGNATRARVLRRAGHLAYRFRDLSEAERLQKESIALARELKDWQTLAGALSGLGWVKYRQNEKATAQGLLHESVEVARESADAWSLANTLESFGRFMYFARRLKEAYTLLYESIVISRKILDKECLARTLTTLAAIELTQGNIQQATLHTEESFTLAQELGTKPLIGLVLSRLGDVALHQKAYEQAQKYFETSISLAYDLGDESAITSRQQKLADLALLQ